MKINRIKLEDFLAFKGSISVDFCDGINVLIGANATGKSTLLKCIYAPCEDSNIIHRIDEFRDQRKQISLDEMVQSDRFVFRPRNRFDLLFQNKVDNGYVEVASGEHIFRCSVMSGRMNDTSDDKWYELDIQSVFIPTTEMLSHSKGLIAMASKHNLPFDQVQLDILNNAQLWETKEITERNETILTMLGDTIEGEVLYENDTFYIVKSSGLKVEFSFEASGYKKLGLLWILIRNGLLEKDSILLWDEPENSLHPELLPLLVDVLYMLQEDGVQVFIATHSYTLAKYIDLKKKNADDARFISLYKDGEIIKASVANRYSGLDNNAIERAEEELYDAVVKKVTGDK